MGHVPILPGSPLQQCGKGSVDAGVPQVTPPSRPGSRRGQSDSQKARLGGVHPLSGWDVAHGRAPAVLCCLWPPSLPGPVWVQRVFRSQAGDGGMQAGAEPAGRRTRHFSLGWCLWMGPGPGVEWPCLAAAPALVVTEDPGGGDRHLAAVPRPKGQGSAWLCHARSSGWASAVPPGCLLRSDATAK